MGGYLTKPKTTVAPESATDDALKAVIIDQVPVAPLVNIIIGYMFYSLPCVDLKVSPLPKQFMTCPRRATNLFGACADRDTLVCGEIERFLILRRSLARHPKMHALLCPHLEGVGVEDGGAVGREMLITKHNASRVAKLIVRPELTSSTIRGADLIQTDDLIRFGFIVKRHCHPKGIILKDCMPDRFVCLRSSETGSVVTKYNLLSREYLMQETSHTERHPGYLCEQRRLCAIYVAWEVLFEGAAEGCMHPTAASDVYAFGCLLFRVFVGVRPWAGQEDHIRDIQRVNADTYHLRHKFAVIPPPLSPFALVSMEDLLLGDRPLFEMIDCCLEPDPRARPSMADVLQCLASKKYNLRVGDRPWIVRLVALRVRWKDYERSQRWGWCG